MSRETLEAPKESKSQPLLRVDRLSWDFVEVSPQGILFSDTREAVLCWSEVVRVAVGYEIHPIAVADWDFWAFQTRDFSVTYWVMGSLWCPQSRHVRERFEVPKVPAMAHWVDRESCIRAYVVWPPADVGKPMYKDVRRHWWSLCSYLAYAEL